MQTKYTLTTTEARKMLDAVRAEANRRKISPSVAITDDGGYLLVFERIEGGQPHTVDVALRKTETAARLRRSTGQMAEGVAKSPQNAAFFPDRLPIQGALPVMYQGQVAGAIGVSGIPSFQESEELAQAGIAALGL